MDRDEMLETIKFILDSYDDDLLASHIRFRNRNTPIRRAI